MIRRKRPPSDKHTTSDLQFAESEVIVKNSMNNHFDVEGRLQHEAGDVAGQDQLREIGQGSGERYRLSLS